LAYLICVILGGGRGARLFPLTKERCKPAIPMGGKYRLIDIPISNCLNSGYGRVLVLTQFNTVSLHRHISRTYPFDVFSHRFVEVLAAQQTLESGDWYQGSADAVRQNLRNLYLERANHVLILSGDQLYRMDYRSMARHHDEHEADATLAVQPVTATQARHLGVLKLSGAGQIVGFAEKPQEEGTLQELALPTPVGKDPDSGEPLTHMASLGIYTFRTSVLRELLESSDSEDFGREVIPAAITRYKVMSFLFLGYWQDIGTIPAFYRANLDLTAPLPRLNLYDETWPFFTRLRSLPPPKFEETRLRESLVADGAIISGSDIQRSVVGLRSVIKEGCVIRDSIVLGYNRYDAEVFPFSDYERPPSGAPPFGIGRGCRIEGAILDKHVRIDEGVVICGRPGNGIDLDESDYCVRDGIVIVPRGQVLRAGTEIVV